MAPPNTLHPNSKARSRNVFTQRQRRKDPETRHRAAEGWRVRTQASARLSARRGSVRASRRIARHRPVLDRRTYVRPSTQIGARYDTTTIRRPDATEAIGPSRESARTAFRPRLEPRRRIQLSFPRPRAAVRRRGGGVFPTPARARQSSRSGNTISMRNRQPPEIGDALTTTSAEARRRDLLRRLQRSSISPTYRRRGKRHAFGTPRRPLHGGEATCQ